MNDACLPIDRNSLIIFKLQKRCFATCETPFLFHFEITLKFNYLIFGSYNQMVGDTLKV